MKRSLYLVILLLLVLQACSTPPTAESPTATTAPTDTPVPTVTPPPTDTPTPVPTSTPDKAATAAAQSTASAQTVLAELDKILGKEDIAYQNGHLLWQQEKPLMVSLKGPGWDYAEIDDNLVGKNFILKSDVTWDATGIIICGAIFRSEPDLVNGKQYEFMYLRLSGLPAWQIAYNEFGKFDNTFTKTQYSDAIDQENEATNQIVLVAQDEQFNVFINGVHQGRYFDYSKQRMEGNFAFTGNQDSGEGTCKFENSWVWALDETD